MALDREPPRPAATDLTGPSSGPVRAEDLEVTLAVRRDLGAEHDPAVIHEFLDRVGAAIDARVDAQLAARTPARPRRVSVGLAVTSLVLGTGTTGITMGTTNGTVGGVIATIAVWVAIVLVNLAVARR